MNPWRPITRLAWLPLTLSFAACGHLSAIRPPPATTAPQIQTPAQAKEPCPLYRLPPNPTKAELDAGYEIRGGQILTCDGRRQLAVDTHEQEHELEAKAAALAERRRRPWWKLW